MSKFSNWINKNKIEIIFLGTIIILYIITQLLINKNNINQTNGLIIIVLTIIITITYLLIFVYRLLKTLSRHYTKREKLKFNGIILSILIIPIQMISNLIIFKNNNLTIYDSYEFMLTIVLSLAVILFLRNKKLI